MSFRPDKDQICKWQSWLRQHHDEVAGCGVPLLVLEDMGNWYYFLEHGYFTPVDGTEPVIDVDHMNSADAERLCLFLEKDDFFPDSVALKRLRYLLKI